MVESRRDSSELLEAAGIIRKKLGQILLRMAVPAALRMNHSHIIFSKRYCISLQASHIYDCNPCLWIFTLLDDVACFSHQDADWNFQASIRCLDLYFFLHLFVRLPTFVCAKIPSSNAICEQNAA